MGVASACLTAVAVGAVTAGVAANVTAPGAGPPTQRVSADVGLTATDFPIIDIDRTVGPLTVFRKLVATYGNSPDEFVAGLFGISTTDWNGSLAHGSTDIRWMNRFSVDTTDGLDTALSVVPPFVSVQGGVGREVGNGGVGVETNFSGSSPEYRSFLKAVPGGATYSGGLSGGNTSAGGTIGLGPVSVTSAVSGGVSSTTNVCLGSAPISCGGAIVTQRISAPLHANLSIPRPGGDVNILAIDIPNNVAVSVAPHRLSVTGDVGGTLKVGPVTLGRIVPLDIQVPRTSMSATSRMLVSDNETGGRHRAPLREAISDVKAAVDNAVHGRHAAED